MTFEIALVLLILLIAMLLFVTERLRMDVVALLVLGSLVLAGLVTPAEALSGFSNPAVVTVWAMFILSAGLSRAGVATFIGHQVLRLAGRREAQLLVVIMLTAGLMSAFMNNVGVAALLLPVVMDIARRTGHSPSRLLMPLAMGCLLGGLNTLIGTPSNILVSDALSAYGFSPFRLFDFTPVGLVVLLGGVIFMVLVGRRLLPVRDIAKEFSAAKQRNLRDIYKLPEQLFVLQLPDGSVLAGKTLFESRLGSALGLNVVGIIRNSHTQLSPKPHTVLRSGDRLLVQGTPEQLLEFRGRHSLTIENEQLAIERLVSGEVEMAEMALSPHSPLLGQTLQQINFRRRYGLNVLAIWRDGVAQRTRFEHMPLQQGDTLLVQGSRVQLDKLSTITDFLISKAEVAEVYQLHERLIMVRVPANSTLTGRTLAESRLGDAFGLNILGIIRNGITRLMPRPTERLLAGDTLLVEGSREDLAMLNGLQHLEIDDEPALGLADLESEQVGLVEAGLSPYTTLAGQTLRQLHFREKYGLSVLAIWRNGQVCGDNFRDIPLEFGDALLLYGPREKLLVLGQEPDFLVLTEAAQEVPRTNKALMAALVMSGVLLAVVLGWLPIAIAAVIGATLMVLTGCLTMDEAYRHIEWRAVFLIAGMLPLGIAMQTTGAAQFLADGLVMITGGWGTGAVLAGLYILTGLATQVMPTPAVAVLMAPIAINTANDLGASPYALVMLVAIAASASALSPVAHPANVLIMGPGGYRFSDYLKVGIPFTIVTLLITLLVLPLFWPLYP
jgi:di/tricarboxylate transporter